MPFVASGENLNIPLVGAFLQNSGAFFIRRTFQNDELYKVLFAEYLVQIMVYGFASLSILFLCFLMTVHGVCHGFSCLSTYVYPYDDGHLVGVGKDITWSSSPRAAALAQANSSTLRWACSRPLCVIASVIYILSHIYPN